MYRLEVEQMSKNKVKKVSNLTLKIEKATEIIETKDFETVKKHMFLFKQIDNDLTIQIKRYARYADYDLDFPVCYLSDLSDKIFEFIKNFQQKFLFSKYKKHFSGHTTISAQMFDDFTKKTADLMVVDTVMREVYKSLSYKAIMYELWSHSESKKDFSTIITEHIRSFL